MRGCTQRRTRRRSGIDGRRRRRGPRRWPRCWRRRRGRRRRGGTAAVWIRPVPRGRARPRRATSSISRPASRRASSRRRASVALVMSASSAIASSGSSLMRSSNADSSSSPTSGRDLVEAVVAAELAPRRRRLLGLVDGVEGLLALLQPGEAPVGAFAFPVFAPSPSGCVVPKISPHSSVMISSVVRSEPSRRRTRPDSAIEDRVEADRRRRDRLLAQGGQRRRRPRWRRARRAPTNRRAGRGASGCAGRARRSSPASGRRPSAPHAATIASSSLADW